MTGSDQWTIASVREQFAGGMSPVKLVEECLGRIAEGNDACNAMIFVGHEEALEAAREAEAALRAGYPTGPLHGIPVALKDVIDVRGWPTTAGSRIFDGYIAERDADCVANLRAAGAIIIGKTNMHELTAGGHANPWFGKVVNPLDLTRGTGGTSSGSAAAVAAGYCIAAIGTDTGGSNRSPAAATGLFGFKPTNGLVSSAGVRPTARTFDAIGPLTNDVADARLLHYAMLGAIAPAPEKVDIRGLHIGLCENLYATEIDPRVADAYETWLTRLARAGATICPLEFPLAEQARDAGRTILFYEFVWEYRDLISRHPDRVGPTIHDFIAEGLAISEDTYKSAIAFQAYARGEFLSLMAGMDMLAVPVSPGLAPRIDDEMTQVGSTFVSWGSAGGGFRRWANLFGMPAMAMPLPVPDDLPASIQIATPPHTDEKLFSICETLARLSA